MKLIVLFAILLVAVVLVVAIAVYLARRGRASLNAEDGATCGQCGYSVRGVSELWCPECGGDLREVGIDRPIGRPKKAGGGLLLVIIAVAMVMMIGIGMVAFLFTSSTPTRTAPATTAMPTAPVKTTTPDSPSSNP